MIFLPVASKLHHIAEAETSLRELTIEGLLAIQAGDNPRVVADKLEAFVPPEERKTAAEKAAAAPAESGGAESRPAESRGLMRPTSNRRRRQQSRRGDHGGEEGGGGSSAGSSPTPT